MSERFLTMPLMVYACILATGLMAAPSEKLIVTNGSGERITDGDQVEMTVRRSGDGFVEADNIRADADRVTVTTRGDRIVSISFENATDIRFGGATRFQSDKPVRGVLTFTEAGVRIECLCPGPAWIKIRVDRLPDRAEVITPAGYRVRTRYQQESSLFGLGLISDKIELMIYY